MSGAIDKARDTVAAKVRETSGPRAGAGSEACFYLGFADGTENGANTAKKSRVQPTWYWSAGRF